MKRHEVLKYLDDIFEMSDHEIAINPALIRETSLAAFSLIKQPVKKKLRGQPANIQTAISNLRKIPDDSNLSRDLVIKILQGCLSRKAG